MQNNQPALMGKDLTILEDQMKQESLACIKAKMYSQQFTNPALKKLASDVAMHHSQNFDKMNQFLAQQG